MSGFRLARSLEGKGFLSTMPFFFLHFATDFSIVQECPTSCQASCKTSENMESVQIYTASVQDTNVVGMNN